LRLSKSKEQDSDHDYINNDQEPGDFAGACRIAFVEYPEALMV